MSPTRSGRSGERRARTPSRWPMAFAAKSCVKRKSRPSFSPPSGGNCSIGSKYVRNILFPPNTPLLYDWGRVIARRIAEGRESDEDQRQSRKESGRHDCRKDCVGRTRSRNAFAAGGFGRGVLCQPDTDSRGAPAARKQRPGAASPQLWGDSEQAELTRDQGSLSSQSGA